MSPIATDNPILVPLDFPSSDAAIDMVRKVSGSVGGFKIGLELFNAVGLPIFEMVQRASPGTRIFYDAKLHDIPNTVAGAVRAAAQHGVWMINVHATGGSDMMLAATEAARKSAKPPLIIAVTVLTSIDSRQLHDELGVESELRDHVVSLALLAKRSGCDGVVASPRETAAIKAACGAEFLVVTPGVRPAGGSLQDQKRVMTPGQAVRDGSDYLVIGRPITAAQDPSSAASAIFDEVRVALGERS